MIAFWICLAALFGAALGSLGTIAFAIAADVARGDEPPPRPQYSVNGGRSKRTTGPQSVYEQLQSRLR
jgi:Spy/CpxP family protein refolding chaperone